MKYRVLIKDILSHAVLWLFLIYLLFLQSEVYGQDTGSGNKKPKIRGQRTLITNEEQAITIQLTDLEVEDNDDWFYPWGFTLKVYPGDHYQVSGNTVTPNLNFNGELTVPVTVNDGKDESDRYDLKITVRGVNDAPVITGQQSINTTGSNPVTLTPSHLIISDPDNDFPGDFTLIVSQGPNYSVSGTTVTPVANFSGQLSVPVKVRDFEAESTVFTLRIGVTAGQKQPTILSQTPVSIDEDQSFAMQFKDLVVSDADDTYPFGFRIILEPGDNYTVSQQTVTPAANYSGTLFVKTRVNDGTHTSEIFEFIISIRAVNDPPIVSFGSESFITKRSPDSLAIFSDIALDDVDNETLNMAEVYFNSADYARGNDILTFKNTSSINGVYDAEAGTLTLVGRATKEEYRTALKSIRAVFPPNEGASLNETKRLYVVVDDGDAANDPAEKTIIISEDGTAPIALDIPTGFTPNGDSVNDTWVIQPLENPQKFETANISVFSRSGTLVFQTTGIQNAWDGKANGYSLPADVYFYIIRMNDGGNVPTLKGTVTILR